MHLDGAFSRAGTLGEQLRARAHADLHARRASADVRTELDARQTSSSGSVETLTAASFFVPRLLGLPRNSTLTLFSGLIPSSPPNAPTPTDAHLFFVLARNRHIADRERLIIWFNGGPGCSSFDGFLMEIGPLRMVPGSTTGEMREVEGAWNEYANVLFLDQPAGTGYSYVQTDGYIHELPDMAAHVVEFLRRFYEIFPEFSTMDTYLAGESYAGQYIPYAADAILSTTVISPPLRGLLIGNGWIDPWHQYPAYRDFSYAAGVVQRNTPAAERVDAAVANCLRALNKLGKDKTPVHEGSCEGVLSTILSTTQQTVNGATLCINTYDVRLTDTWPACGMNWPPDLKSLYEYLPRNDVKAAFHASAKEGAWVECSGAVSGNFYAQTSRPSVELLPRLLEQIPILLFAGEQDLICNWFGLRDMVANLTWNGATGFTTSEAQNWLVDGVPAGTWQTERNLSFVLVANASHMAPFDVPLATSDMLIRFMAADLISAAGPAAKVPSRIGSETEAVISETHVNGTALGAETVVDPNAPVPVKSGAETVREAYYNVGSAAVILFLVLCCVGIFFYLRSRVRLELASRGATPSAGFAPLGGGASDKPRRRRRQHGRNRSSLSTVQGRHSVGDAQAGEGHELDELVVERPEEEDEEDEGRKPAYQPRRTTRQPLREAETVFSLDDDDEEGGDIGRVADDAGKRGDLAV